ncbi:MAG: PD40 domain-containing protein [Ktedonobacteraceae bacterium]|nr:PD40 domain-containing protein [Ktedonobacteraceae bacterium]
MKKCRFLYAAFSLLLLSLSLQSCLGSGNTTNSNDFKTVGANGSTIGINSTDQATFKGNIYFTLNHNLYVLDGTRVPRQLTHNLMVMDPTISPDGKWIAFSVRYPNYSDIAYMSVNGGPLHTVITGKGQFYAANGDGTNNYYWCAQPAWSPDSKNLLFLSDLQKQFFWKSLGAPFNNAYFSDMQIFTLPIGQPTLVAKDVNTTVQAVAYASYGDGGDRDPMYRPHNNDQIAFTHYQYDPSGTQQIIQIFLEDPNAIANHPGVYNPVDDPAVPLTPANTNQQSMEPAFSPDGNSIAYIRRQSSTSTGLYVMPAANNVTQDPNNPAVQKVALQPFNKSALILSGQYISDPIWSPDGKQIAYLSYSNNFFDLWLATVRVDKAGKYKMAGSPVQLTSANGQLDGDSRPLWSA